MQSPISVDKESSITRNYTPFHFSNYNKKYDAVISCNEHAISIDLWPEGGLPSVSGGGLYHEYVLVALDFHWDSEHVINNKRYVLEVQLIHYAKKYGDILNALNFKDGIAIFSTFYEVSQRPNEAIQNMLESIPPVEMKIERQVELERYVKPEYFLPPKITKFYRYNGSITKPCFNETVIWTLFSNPSHITKLQLDELSNKWRAIFKCCKNCRLLQDVNERRVYLSAI